MKSHSLRAAAAALALALVLNACGGARPHAPGPGNPSATLRTTPGDDERLEAVLAARGQTETAGREYVIGSGDLLTVTIYSFRPGGGNFAADIRVDDRGYMSLPMIDPVLAAGLSLAELRSALVRELEEAGLLYAPLVSVFLKDYQGQQVIILGAVARPGQYSLSRGRHTLVDILSMAGGLTERAGNHLLFRPAHGGAGSPTAGSPLAQGYALRTASATAPDPDTDMIAIPLRSANNDTSAAALTLPVQGGDLFVVSEAGQAFIEGEVAEPGLYPLSHGMTLMQLIPTAGGLTFPANPHRVTLVRASGTGNTTQWEIDIDRIADQEQSDILLEPNDRVLVPATSGKKIAHGFYLTVTRLITFTVGGAATLF